MTFYGQAKLAAALYAKELSRRLRRRAIAVNSLNVRRRQRHGLALMIEDATLHEIGGANERATAALLAPGESQCHWNHRREYWSDCQSRRGKSAGCVTARACKASLAGISMQIVQRIKNATRTNAGGAMIRREAVERSA